MSIVIRNYTPHTVHLHTDLGVSSLRSDGIARCSEVETRTEIVQWDPHGDGGMQLSVPLVTKSWGEVSGLPEPSRGTLYIVSSVVQAALPNRTDLVSPHDIMRDADGVVVGCRALARVW